MTARRYNRAEQRSCRKRADDERGLGYQSSPGRSRILCSAREFKIFVVLAASAALGVCAAFSVQSLSSAAPFVQWRRQRRVLLRVSSDDATVVQTGKDPAEANDADPPPTATSNVSSMAFSEGSPEELMYTLGVNLARQLGDVRPLVQNSDELTAVAKGLLDTVVGRLSDHQQQTLLARRGSELNQLITSRA
jgi:hypothetical protein